MARELTEKQRRFIDFYMGEARGNATEAAKLAGYKGDDVVLASVGYENIRNPQIMDAINKMREPGILTRQEIRRFWSDTVREGLVNAERLKASELLAKSRGMFLERRELSGPKGGPINIKAEDISDDELAAIIARGRAKKAAEGK